MFKTASNAAAETSAGDTKNPEETSTPQAPGTDEEVSGGSSSESGSNAAEASDPDGTEQKDGTDWKAMSRRWEGRAKENLRAVQDLETRIKDSTATIEDLRSQVAEYEHTRQIAEWRAQVSKDTGVPADALRGESLEEITAHAQILQPLLTPAGSRTVLGDGVGKYPPRKTALTLDEQIAAAQTAGEQARVAELKAQKLAALSR